MSGRRAKQERRLIRYVWEQEAYIDERPRRRDVVRLRARLQHMVDVLDASDRDTRDPWFAGAPERMPQQRRPKHSARFFRRGASRLKLALEKLDQLRREVRTRQLDTTVEVGGYGSAAGEELALEKIARAIEAKPWG